MSTTAALGPLKSSSVSIGASVSDSIIVTDRDISLSSCDNISVSTTFSVSIGIGVSVSYSAVVNARSVERWLHRLAFSVAVSISVGDSIGAGSGRLTVRSLNHGPAGLGLVFADDLRFRAGAR